MSLNSGEVTVQVQSGEITRKNNGVYMYRPTGKESGIVTPVFVAVLLTDELARVQLAKVQALEGVSFIEPLPKPVENYSDSGIVRRIDDLGRVVIPKEIRRKMRVSDGDPLSIHMGYDGSIKITRYSTLGRSLRDHAESIAVSLYEMTGAMVFITDTHELIARAAPRNGWAGPRNGWAGPRNGSATGEVVEDFLDTGEQERSLHSNDPRLCAIIAGHTLLKEGEEFDLIIRRIGSMREPIGCVILLSTSDGRNSGSKVLGDIDVLPPAPTPPARFLATTRSAVEFAANYLATSVASYDGRL